MTFICPYNHHTSLIASGTRITRVDSGNDRVDEYKLPPNSGTIRGIVQLRKEYVHVVTVLGNVFLLTQPRHSLPMDIRLVREGRK